MLAYVGQASKVKIEGVILFTLPRLFCFVNVICLISWRVDGGQAYELAGRDYVFVVGQLAAVHMALAMLPTSRYLLFLYAWCFQSI